MNKDKALELALEALEFDGFMPEDLTHRSLHAKAITAIKQALAAPVQPVAWINAEKRTFEWNGPVLWNTPTVAVMDKIPLYTTPPAAQRQWQSLTEDELIKCTPTWGGTVEDAARAVEAKLREKNT